MEPSTDLVSSRLLIMPQLPDLRTVYLTELLVDHLPNLSRPMQELQWLLEAGSIDLERVCASLSQDPVIYQNFVQIGRMAEPGDFAISLDHLVVMLGKARTWTVAVAAFVLKEIEKTWAVPVIKQVAALARRQAAAAIQEATHREDQDREQAYVYGLLSIIGLLPLIELTALEEDTQGWVGISPDAIGRQREYFGTDCIELARWIKLLWHVRLESPHGQSTKAPYGPAAAYPARLGKLCRFPETPGQTSIQ